MFEKRHYDFLAEFVKENSKHMSMETIIQLCVCLKRENQNFNVITFLNKSIKDNHTTKIYNVIKESVYYRLCK